MSRLYQKVPTAPFRCLDFFNEVFACILLDIVCEPDAGTYFIYSFITNAHHWNWSLALKSVLFPFRFNYLVLRFVSSSPWPWFHFTIFQFNAQEGMEGNTSAGMMKNVMRAFAAATVPLTLTFPKVWGAKIISWYQTVPITVNICSQWSIYITEFSLLPH